MREYLMQVKFDASLEYRSQNGYVCTASKVDASLVSCQTTHETKLKLVYMNPLNSALQSLVRNTSRNEWTKLRNTA